MISYGCLRIGLTKYLWVSRWLTLRADEISSQNPEESLVEISDEQIGTYDRGGAIETNPLLISNLTVTNRKSDTEIFQPIR